MRYSQYLLAQAQEEFYNIFDFRLSPLRFKESDQLWDRLLVALRARALKYKKLQSVLEVRQTSDPEELIEWFDQYGFSDRILLKGDIELAEEEEVVDFSVDRPQLYALYRYNHSVEWCLLIYVPKEDLVEF